MADLEKVSKGIEACVGHDRLMICSTCPYHVDASKCVSTLMRDALALLKEQEEKIASLQTTINRLHEGIQKAVKWNA